MVQGPGENAGVLRLPRRAGPWRSRSSRTTTRRRSSPTRARPPASAASCATCSPWARGPSRCSTRLRFGPLDSAAQPLPLRRRGEAASATTATASACPTWAARSTSPPAYERQSAGQRHVRRAAARGGADPRRGRTASATPHRRRRPHRPRRHPRRSFASEDLSEKSEARRPQVQVGDPFTEKLLLEATLELIASGHDRRHPGHGRRRPDVVARPRWRRAAASASRSTPAGADARSRA